MGREREGSVVFDGGRVYIGRLVMAVFALLVTLFVFALLASCTRWFSLKRGGAPGEVRFLKPSTPPSSLARFIHWLTAPSVTPKARAISL